MTHLCYRLDVECVHDVMHMVTASGFCRIVLVQEARRCIYGHELEGYKQVCRCGSGRLHHT